MAAAAERTDYERAAVAARQDPGHRADDGEPEDGRLRPDRARPARAGPPGQPGRHPAVRHPRRQDDRPRRVPARGRPRGDRRRGADAASSSSTTPAPGRSRARSTCRPPIGETAVLEAFLAERRGGPVHLRVPQRGEKRELLALATRNAGETLAREQARWLADQGKTLAALEELAEALGLPGPPLRIECYDISNFQGSESVGSMVVFEDGKPRSGEYRRFRIKTVKGPNDFASHQEVLRRRFRTVRTGEEGVEEARRWAMPDLVIVDGGKGQVSAAKEVLDELGLHDLPLAGLAKEREELFLPGRVRARSSCPRRRRPCTSSSGCATRRTGSRSPTTATCGRSGASARRSTTCPASGPKRKRELLKVFGSIKRVRDAPVEQIAAVPGHRAGPGGADQGDAGGLTRRLGSEFFIVPVHRIATGAGYGRLIDPSPGRMPEGMPPRCPPRDRTARRAAACRRARPDQSPSDAVRPSFRVTSRLDA